MMPLFSRNSPIMHLTADYQFVLLNNIQLLFAYGFSYSYKRNCSRGAYHYMRNTKLMKLTVSNFGISALNVFLSTYMPLYLTASGANTMAISAIISAGFFMGMVLQPLSGILSDSLKRIFHTRKIIFLFFGIAASVCIGIIPRLHNRGHLYTAVIILFAVFHIYQVPLSAMVPDNTSLLERNSSSAWWSMMGMSGSLIIPILAAVLWNTARKSIFDILILIILATVFIPSFCIIENNKYKKMSRISLKDLLSTENGKTMISFYKMKICWWTAAGFIIPFFPYYMNDVFGIKVTSISFTIQLTLAAGIFVSILFVRRKGNINRLALMTGCLIYILIYSVIYIISANIYAAVLLMILYGGVLAIFTAVPLSILYQIMPPDRYGEFLGIDNIFLNLPQSLSIGAAGIMYAAVGIRSIFSISLIFSLVTILLIRKFKQGL